ncbi:MAG TPA: penicillin-binding protein, partial [Patescibacteria group bacterium]|nr:penicillin-binding protein [Patescibacteria group bacterium]
MKIYNYQTQQQKSEAARFSASSGGKARQKFSFKNWRGWLHDLPWNVIGTWAFRVGAAGVLLIAFLFIYYSRSLPDPNRLLGRNVPESTKIYAKDDSLLYEVHGEVKRTLVNLDQINPNLKNATLVAEDRNFYSHAGISITGLIRSVIVDVIHRSKVQGGSTITQQFVKNAMLSNDKSYVRKIKEIVLSIELEARFSKDEILKMYLNEIPYGRNAYGVEAAAQTYFNKHASDLSIAESAYLAALPQAPSYYNPSGPHFDDLQARQQYILNQMKDLGYISNDQLQQAMNEDVQFQQIKNSIVAPHFVQYVEDYVADKYGEQALREGGLKVYTTLDPHLQEIAEKAVADGAAKNTSAGGYNAALVAMDPKTGQILAMVGSKDYFGENYPKNCNPKTCLFSPNVNIATTLQQPGSSFKPYAYVTAFGKDFKYSPASMLVDVKTDFGGGYSPNNFNLSSNGPVSMRKALAGSLNVPAVKTIALVSPDKVIETARSLGITSQFNDCGLSLVLGGCDITLLDHTAAYAALANKGNRSDKTAILKIVSQEGKTLEEYKEHREQVLDEQAVYEVTNIMSDNSARAYVFGANSPLQLGNRPVAAKTGTTQDFRDGWTMGFTPSLAAGVWTGNNNNAPMKKDAVVMAGPIWHQFMAEALKDTPIEQFDRPSGIKEVTVDAVSGKLPTQYTQQTKTEIFADYAVPTSYDDVHIAAPDGWTGQIIQDPNNPAATVSSLPAGVCMTLHSERRDNPNWENPVVAYGRANGYCYPGQQTPSDNKIQITSPSDGTTITKVPVTVSANVQGNNITKVDVSVDGSFVGSADTAPYKVKLNQEYLDGQHTITAKVVYSDNSTATDSVDVQYALNGGLEMSVSGGGSDFPLDLSADS